MIMYKNEVAQVDYSTKMYFATSSDPTQDCFSTMAYLEQILKAFLADVPHIQKIKIFSDGAGTFSGTLSRVVCPRLFAKYGIQLVEFVTGEAGNGKGLVDAIFSLVRAALERYVVKKKGYGDVIDSESLATALRSEMGDKVEVLHVLVLRIMECAGFHSKIFQGLLSSVSALKFVDFVSEEDTEGFKAFTTVFHQHSGIGLGLSFSPEDINAGWVQTKQAFPLSSLISPCTPILESYRAVNPDAPKSIFTCVESEESKQLARLERLSKKANVQQRKIDTLQLATGARRRIAEKNGTMLSCSVDNCNRMFITTRRLHEHCERGNHSDGINFFRSKPGESTGRSTLSLRDSVKKHIISVLDGSTCSLVQRQPHHLTDGSTRQTEPNEHNILPELQGAHFLPDAGFGKQSAEPHVRREFKVIEYLYLVFHYGNEDKLYLTTADQAATDMPLFGTILGQQKHAGHPLWKPNSDDMPTFRVRHLLTTAVIKGYFSKKPADFLKQYERAKLKNEKELGHVIVPSAVIPQQQPFAAMQEPNRFHGVASSAEHNSDSSDSDSSDSDLDNSSDVEELVLIANSATKALEQQRHSHAGGEDCQGGLIETSTENRERLVGGSLESLELAQARRAARLNTTTGIAAELAADSNVPAGISGKPLGNPQYVMYL